MKYSAKNLILWLLISFCCLHVQESLAYIPSVDMILKKTTASNREGWWKIRLHVSAESDPQNNIFEETWTVGDANTMRLQVRGLSPGNKNFTHEVLYKGGRRHLVTETGLTSAKIPTNCFERIFHFADGAQFKQYLKDSLILVAQAPVAKADAKKEVKPEHTEFIYVRDPLVRLSRAGGVIAYALGEPTAAEAAVPAPGLWIEQDRFHLLRLRLLESVDIHVSKYKKFTNKWFPEVRQLSWGKEKVRILTEDIEKIPADSKVRKQMTPEALKVGNSSTDIPAIGEFYQRFR